MDSLLESHRRGVRQANRTGHIHLSKIQWNQKQRLCVILFVCCFLSFVEIVASRGSDCSDLLVLLFYIPSTRTIGVRYHVC